MVSQTASKVLFAMTPVHGLKFVFSDTKCAIDSVKCAVDFAGVCYVK